MCFNLTISVLSRIKITQYYDIYLEVDDKKALLEEEATLLKLVIQKVEKTTTNNMNIVALLALLVIHCVNAKVRIKIFLELLQVICWMVFLAVLV